MKRFLCLTLVLVALHLKSQDTVTIINRGKEIEYLRPAFMKDPFRKVGNDLFRFTYSKDSIIVVDSVSISAKASLWVLYKDHGDFNFWGGHNEKAPKEYIRKYFQNRGITLQDIYIYVSATGRESYDMCGFCYQGYDFLFKMSATAFKVFEEWKIADVIRLNSKYFGAD